MLMQKDFLLSEKIVNFVFMKKVAQINKTFGDKRVTYTVDEELNKLAGKNLAPKKLAEANKVLRTLKPPFPDNLDLGKFTPLT